MHNFIYIYVFEARGALICFYLYYSIFDENVEMFTLGNGELCMLLFADDIAVVLFLYTKEGLQKSVR